MVGALVDDPATPELLALLADEELHAPALLDFEVASALRGHVFGGLLDQVRVDEALEDFTALRIERYQMSDALGHIPDHAAARLVSGIGCYNTVTHSRA